jgi:hypothetical protein
MIPYGYKVVPYKGTEEQRGYFIKWIEALESGEYEQCRMTLRKGNQYCCLGVMCDLYDPNGWLNDYHLAMPLVPSSVVRQHFGLQYALVKEDGQLVPYAKLNDNYKLSFSEIAAIARESLK